MCGQRDTVGAGFCGQRDSDTRRGLCGQRDSDSVGEGLCRQRDSSSVGEGLCGRDSDSVGDGLCGQRDNNTVGEEKVFNQVCTEKDLNERSFQITSSFEL